MRRRSWLVALVLVIVVVASTIGATSAFAHGSTADDPAVPDGGWWDMAGHCPGMSEGWGMGSYHSVNDQVTLGRVAGTLGLTYDELTARLTKGETIARVAEAQGVNPSLVVATILAPQSEILQVRVKYGYLTEAQAQATLEQVRYWVEQSIAAPQYGYYSPRTSPPGGSSGMMGGGMMGGGMMGRW